MNTSSAEIIALWPFVVIFLSLIPLRAVMTTVHEAGHAIAMALLTKEQVSVYLGSYGDKQNSLNFKLGHFDIWVRKNIFKWKGGVCIPADIKVSIKSLIIIILAGPLATLLMMVIPLVIYFISRPHAAFAAFLVLWAIIAGFSFLYNIVPAYAAIISSEGELVYNDGAQISQLLQSKKLPPEINDAQRLFEEKNYKEAVVIFEKIIDKGTKSADIYRMAITAHIQLRNYSIADKIQKQQIARIGNLTTHDRINLALLKTFLGNYDEAVAYYKHLLLSGGNNKFNLNNLGYTLTLMARYAEAVEYLDKANAIDPNFANPYASRAFAKMKMGFLDDGKKDNDYSMQLDDTNSYVYRNSGIYFYERGQYGLALEQFNKAKEIDPHTDFLNKYILDASAKLSE